jgi:ABC-2 type transport system permease protein
MSTLVAHSAYLTNRSVKAMLRQPIFVFVTLIQPMVWLLLFGQLFKSVTEIPGFAGSGSYVEFLTPGVVAMTALFNAAWAGTVYIEDMNRGVMDRLLASPVSRGAMMNGTLAYQSLVCTVAVIDWWASVPFIIAPRETGEARSRSMTPRCMSSM